MLATSSQVNQYVGSLPSTPIQLGIYPDPSGDAIAVVLNPLTPITGNVPMVILNRQGHLLAALNEHDGPISGTQPIWSPNGRSGYPTYTNTGAALAIATETGTIPGSLGTNGEHHLRTMRVVSQLDRCPLSKQIGKSLPLALRHAD